MPLQKRKKKKPASDKSVKQVVSQVVKVNIGDTKPKKKRRKRKSSGGAAPSAAPPPMLAQVPQQQFIYSPPPPIPQEPLAPPRQSAPSFSATAVMPDLSFKDLSLSDFEGKYVVLFFYPFDFTYVCPT